MKLRMLFSIPTLFFVTLSSLPGPSFGAPPRLRDANSPRYRDVTRTQSFGSCSQLPTENPRAYDVERFEQIARDANRMLERANSELRRIQDRIDFNERAIRENERTIMGLRSLIQQKREELSRIEEGARQGGGRNQPLKDDFPPEEISPDHPEDRQDGVIGSARGGNRNNPRRPDAPLRPEGGNRPTPPVPVVVDNSRREQLQREIRDLTAQMDEVIRLKAIQENENNNLRLDLPVRVRRAEDARRELNLAQNEVRAAEVRIRNAECYFESLGEDDGSLHGSNAADQLGDEYGFRHGISEYQEIKSKATADGAAGYETGKRQGLAKAYSKGKVEGDLAARSAATRDQGAYDSGRSAGKNRALQLATQDAQPAYIEAKTTRRAFYRSQSLNAVVVGTKPTPKYEGLQELAINERRPSSSDLDRYNRESEGFRRRVPSSLQSISSFERAYRRSYDEAFRHGLRSGYFLAYGSAYRAEMISRFRQDVRNDSFTTRFNDEMRSVSNSADGSAISRLYQITLSNLTGDITETNRLAGVRDFENNAGEIARGKVDGNRETSRTLGDDLGFRETYTQATKERIKQEEIGRGISEVNTRYTSTAVTEVVSIDVVDADADGVFRPGEPVIVMAKVKNYGRVPDSQFLSTLQSLGGEATRLSATASSVIPALANADVYFTAQVQVNASAKVGGTLSLKINMQDRNQGLDDSARVVSVDLTRSVQFPVLLQALNFNGVFRPKEEKVVTFKIMNSSRAPHKLQLDLQSGQFLSVLNPPAGDLVLKAGASTELKLTYKVAPEALLEETFVRLNAKEDGLVFAEGLAIASAIVPPHKYNEQSRGILISGNLAQGSARSLFQAYRAADGLPQFDTWDLFGDGGLPLEKLTTYANGKKTIVLLLDGNKVDGTPGSLDATTANSITQFVNANAGSMVVIASQVGSAMLNQIAAAVPAVVNSASLGTNMQVEGVNTFGGITFHHSGSLTPLFIANGRLAKTTFVAPGLSPDANMRTVGALVLGDVSKDQYSQNLVLSLGFAGVNGSAIATALNPILAVHANSLAPFSKKVAAIVALANASQKPTLPGLVNALLGELKDEMYFGAMNPGQRYYQNFAAARDRNNISKLERIARSLVNHPDRDIKRALLTSFETLYQYARALPDNNEKSSIRFIFEGVNQSPTTKPWAQAYCLANGVNEALCKQLRRERVIPDTTTGGGNGR